MPRAGTGLLLRLTTKRSLGRMPPSARRRQPLTSITCCGSIRRTPHGYARTGNRSFSLTAVPGKISTVTVIPGYDDSKLSRPPPRPITQRWGGETYRALWQEAVAAAPDYVLITSWNEWHEGSEIEPSVEYGSVMLNDTAAFARQFLTDRK